MKVLITGGTGLIGQKLVQAMLEQGYLVTILSRQPASAVKKLWSLDVESVTNIADLSHEDPFQAVINLAGEGIMDKRWTATRKKQLIASRVGLTLELMDFLGKVNQRPDVLLSGSAIGYYGSHPPSDKLDESSDSGDDFPASLCLRWEQSAQRAEKLGMRVCTIRTGIVLHPSGGALQKLLPTFRFGLGGAIASGEQMMSWIHIDDMVRLMMFLLVNEHAKGVYNATAPNPISNKEFSKTLGQILHRPAFLTIPATVLRIALGESSQLLIEGQAVHPNKLINSGFSFLYPDIKVALTNLLS